MPNTFLCLRILIAAATSSKKTLYIVFLDFSAAFDRVSRRILFKKLVKMGIGATYLSALIAIYSVTENLVFANNEASDKFITNAGIRQGLPSSPLLFIAYINDMITLFRSTFQSEDIINMIHILIHADDTVILATSRKMVEIS